MRDDTKTKQKIHNWINTINSNRYINIRERKHNGINGHIYKICLMQTPIGTVANLYLIILFLAFINAQNSRYIAGSYIK